MARKKKISPEEILAGIRKKLKHAVLEKEEELYFRLGSKRLNKVFGNEERGVRFGQCTELFGPKSVGKSVLAAVMLSMAQRAGAWGVLIDAELSYKPAWWRVHGVDTAKLVRIRPELVTIGKNKGTKMLSAEDMFHEAEQACLDIKGPKMLIVDSVAALSPAEELSRDVDDQNMRSKLALATMLSSVLRRWAGLGPATDTFMLCLNQVRTNPMAMFGDPTYTPGGNALGFYSHVRVRAAPHKGGMILDSGKEQIGAQGILYNVKNKEGPPRRSAAYRIMFDGNREILSAKELKSEK